MNKPRLAVLLAGLLATSAWADCDAETGAKVYNKCIACHSVEADVHMMGPSLHGLFGRQVGTAEGFVYSEAMAAADFVWDAPTLSAFLEGPMQYLPGTSMPFAGLRKAEQRKALNCYLASVGESQ